MSQVKAQNFPREKFLTMATNLLHKVFMDSGRTLAKNVYKDISSGKSLYLTTVELEDKSTVRFDLALDYSEYRGKLNFGAFKSSVQLLIANLVQALKDEEKEVVVFEAEGNADVLIFGVTAATQEAGETNVMVLGSDSGSERSSVLLRLMYLNHSQFENDTKSEQSSQGEQLT